MNSSVLHRLGSCDGVDVASIVMGKLSVRDRHAVRCCGNPAFVQMVNDGVRHIDLSRMLVMDDKLTTRKVLSRMFPNASELSWGVCTNPTSEDMLALRNITKDILQSDTRLLERTKSMHIKGYIVHPESDMQTRELTISLLREMLSACKNLVRLTVNTAGIPAMTLMHEPLLGLDTFVDAMGRVWKGESVKDVLICDACTHHSQLVSIRLTSDMYPHGMFTHSICNSLTGLTVLGGGNINNRDMFFASNNGSVSLPSSRGACFLRSVTTLTNLHTFVFQTQPEANTTKILHVPDCWKTMSSLSVLDLAADKLYNDYAVIPHMVGLKYLRLSNTYVGTMCSLNTLTNLVYLSIQCAAHTPLMPWERLVNANVLKTLVMVNCTDLPDCGIPTSVTELNVSFASFRAGLTSGSLMSSLPTLQGLRILTLRNTLLPTIFLSHVTKVFVDMEYMHLEKVDFVPMRASPCVPTILPKLTAFFHSPHIFAYSEHDTEAIFSHLYMPRVQHISLNGPISLGTFNILTQNYRDVVHEIPLNVVLDDDQYITASIQFLNKAVREWTDEGHTVGMAAVTDNGVQLSLCLTRQCTETLDLIPTKTCQLPVLTDVTLESVVKYCKDDASLKCLRVCSGKADSGFTGYGVNALLGCINIASTLVHLELWSCTGITNHHMYLFEENRFPGLENLLLSGMTDVGSVGYACISRIPKLKRLGLLGATNVALSYFMDLELLVLCREDFRDVDTDLNNNIKWLDSYTPVTDVFS